MVRPGEDVSASWEPSQEREGEIKGKEMRSNRNKKENTRMAQEATSHEEERAEMERKSMSDR